MAAVVCEASLAEIFQDQLLLSIIENTLNLSNHVLLSGANASFFFLFEIGFRNEGLLS